MNNTKKRRNRNALLVLTGAIAGAAATYYLHTPKGKKLKENVITKGKELGETLADKAQAIANDVKENASKAIEIANEQIDLAKEIITEQTKEIVTHKEDNTSSFAKGIQKAKNSILNGEVIS